MLTDKKLELESRIETLIEEREAMQVMMDEMQERVMYKDRLHREQEMKLRSQTRDIDEMREVNSHLQARLDTVLQRTSTPSNCSTSLFNEIEMSSQASSSVDDDITSLMGSQVNFTFFHLFLVFLITCGIVSSASFIYISSAD